MVIELNNDDIKGVLEEISQHTPLVYLEANRSIGLASAAIEAVNNRLLKKYGLNHTGMTMLYLLVENGGKMNMPDLTKKTCLSRQAVATITRNFEGRGLVTREGTKSDRRRMRIKITAKGLELVRQTGLSDERKRIHKVLESFASEEEAKLINKILTKVIGNMRRMRY